MTHTGAPRSQLTHWTNTGLISAGIAEAAGTGHHRVFSLRDLVEIYTPFFEAQPSDRAVLVFFDALRRRLTARDFALVVDSAMWKKARVSLGIRK